MNNILYLDDYINFYHNNNIYVYKPLKKSLEYGKIYNKDKFIRSYNNMLNKNHIKYSLFSENIYVIINNTYSDIDKEYLIDILKYLNYKHIYFINELKYIDINKNKVIINVSNSYYYIIYTNIYGNIEVNIYKLNEINNKVLLNILDHLNKKEIILYGKNYKEIENIIDNKYNYYIYEYYNNLIINIIC